MLEELVVQLLADKALFFPDAGVFVGDIMAEHNRFRADRYLRRRDTYRAEAPVPRYRESLDGSPRVPEVGQFE